MKLRAYAALGVVCIGLVACDVVQRIVIAPWVKLRPSRRIPALGRWQDFMARFVLKSVSWIGGAKLPPTPVKIPPEPGRLILMNHQSLFDIPLVVQLVDRGYPRIVTRTRYSRSIPLISHMARLYQYPTVDPRAKRSELRANLDSLEREGRESDVPMVVFPEGSRTLDGEIGPFKAGAVSRLLRARPWTVHVVVADGFWRAARFADLVHGMGSLDGRFVEAGVIEWTDPTADPGPLLGEAHRMMVAALADLRGGRTAA